MPVHNEDAVLEAKLSNLTSLDYPQELLQIIVVSDGSTDRSNDILRRYEASGRIEFVEVADRAGKANALNAGLNLVCNSVTVFTDASIVLSQDALREIAKPFDDPEVGCVSGHDQITDRNTEGAYGRYELYLRRLESVTTSIVGASGSFYAQRSELNTTFKPNFAPDFYSVLMVVKQGFRAISWPAAIGFMTSADDSSEEYRRKIRTVLRGLTTMLAHAELLNPWRFGLFSFALLSHKLLRWLAPVFLVLLLLCNIMLLPSAFFGLVLFGQIAFYGVALWGVLAKAHSVPGFARLSAFFLLSNAAILVAWQQYLLGQRQELWNPTKRDGALAVALDENKTHGETSATRESNSVGTKS